MINRITGLQYKSAKAIVVEYERLEKIKGTSECPFCGGCKTKPYVIPFKSQDCTDCNSKGRISNRTLAEMDLEDLIEKKK